MAQKPLFRSTPRKSSPLRTALKFTVAAGTIGAAVALIDGDDLNAVAERPIWTEFQCAASNGGHAEVYTTLLSNGLAIKDQNGTAVYTDFHTDGIDQQISAARAFCENGGLPKAAAERRAFWNGDFTCTGRNGERGAVDSGISTTRVDMGEHTTSVSPMMYNPAIAKVRSYCAGGENPLAAGQDLKFE